MGLLPGFKITTGSIKLVIIFFFYRKSCSKHKPILGLLGDCLKFRNKWQALQRYINGVITERALSVSGKWFQLLHCISLD